MSVVFLPQVCVCPCVCVCVCAGGNSHPRQEKEGRAQQHSGRDEESCCQEGVARVMTNKCVYVNTSFGLLSFIETAEAAH